MYLFLKFTYIRLYLYILIKHFDNSTVWVGFNLLLDGLPCTCPFKQTLCAKPSQHVTDKQTLCAKPSQNVTDKLTLNSVFLPMPYIKSTVVFTIF